MGTNIEKPYWSLLSAAQKKISYLQKGLAEGSSSHRALLASLRKSVSKPIEQAHPRVYSLLYQGNMLNLPEHVGDFTSDRENSLYRALTLYALHSQGAMGTKAHNEDIKNMGEAIARYALSKHGAITYTSIQRRFEAIMSSDSIEEFEHYLRQIIMLLRTEKIGINYPQLTVDHWQFSSPEHRGKVRLRWGKSFYTYGDDGSGDDSVVPPLD